MTRPAFTTPLRRTAGFLLTAALSSAVLVGVPSAAHAAADITGRLRDLTTNETVSGQTIRLRANDAGAPGAIVDTAVTNGTGDFSLTPDVAGRRYFLQLVAGDYQSGYLGVSNQWFIRLGEEPQLWDPGTTLGAVFGYPAFATGTVVNQDTGAPVSRILVTLRGLGPAHEVLARDRTNGDGAYRMEGLTRDEYAVKFNGSTRGYETGYLGCLHGVVQTWGEACSHGTGYLGKARLERL